MNVYELLNIKARNNPDSLLKLQVRVAIVSIITVVILSGYGFYQVFSGFVIKTAEKISLQLCEVLIDQQKDFIFVYAPEKPVELGLRGGDIHAFDLNLRHYLDPFDIIKVKIYDPKAVIVYCTDPSLIGKSDNNNKRLKIALAGNVDAKMVTKDKARDLSDEELLDVDVVETYVPIKGENNRVVGCFEIYLNTTIYRDQIRFGAVVMTALLTLILAGVFGFSYVLIRGGIGQLKEVQSQLEMIAITDPLTGIPNRGFLMKRGAEEFVRVRRSSLPLSCIMLDLDHFKKINDTKGHVAGDFVLKGVAERLLGSVRPYDVVGRYGGEEFMVLLPGTRFEQSQVVADRICENIRNAPFEAGGELLPVTVSVGVAESRQTDLALNDIVKRADEGLYKAKIGGRDRVAWID